MSAPGAATSMSSESRFDQYGAEFERLRALTATTCGSAAGQDAYCSGHLSVVQFPAAATTSTPFRVA